MEEFKQVHAQILKLGLFLDSFCGSNLVATCALSKWGSMEYACSIFRQIEEPGSFEYNTMIRGRVNNMNLEETLFLYVEMLERGIEPDKFTYPFVFKACSLLGALKEGVQIHGHIFKAGLDGDTFVQNSLISMYGKCGAIKHAYAVFEQMDERSVASWSAIIGALHKDPMEFKPERFLRHDKGDAKFDLKGTIDIKMMPFGAGRRVCPAISMATLHLEYFVANLVRDFKWTLEEGCEVDMSEKQVFSIVMKNPLRPCVSPRINHLKTSI
uniref:Pentatricopeptide repeat-containing protein At1g31920 family n=1 Tax=Cajanus cajan TaxID=3821 RepID=A0A151SI15_CAJCA|nr:Pentatricopeptide repeat-containing protein At1g31920 family [Cajanus cajan]